MVLSRQTLTLWSSKAIPSLSNGFRQNVIKALRMAKPVCEGRSTALDEGKVAVSAITLTTPNPEWPRVASISSVTSKSYDDGNDMGSFNTISVPFNKHLPSIIGGKANNTLVLLRFIQDGFTHPMSRRRRQPFLRRRQYHKTVL